MTTFSPSILKLIPEVEYIVSINNIDYTLIAQEKLDGNKKIVFIGNETLNEIESLPFLIEYEYNIQNEIYGNSFYYNGNIPTLTLSIYINTEDINIIFYDKRGRPVEYSGIETISMDTVIENAQTTFSRGTIINLPPQDLIMVDGENQIIDIQHIQAEKGQLLKSIDIIRPDTLVPENIKKNINIAGIEGTFAGDEVEKTVELNYSTEYAKAYSYDELQDFAIAENENKIIRVMYDPGDFFNYGIKHLAYYQCVSSGDGTYKIQLINTENVPVKDEVIVEADEDTVLTKVFIPKDENLKSEYIKKDIDISGVSGSFIGNEEKCNIENLIFNDGPAVFTPSEDHLFSEVNISIPTNLTPENIKSGINIAGIEGTYVFENLPTLYPPSNISDVNYRESTSTTSYITVTNPTAKNGYFCKACQLYIENTETGDDIPVAYKAMSQGASSVNFYATDWTQDVLKAGTIKAKFFGGNSFNPSEAYAVTRTQSNSGFGLYGVTSINYDVKNATFSYNPNRIYWGQWISTNITPKTGYYIPKKVSVKLDDGVSAGSENLGAIDTVIYNNTNGNLIIKYGRIDSSLKNSKGEILYALPGTKMSITGEAPNMPWLKDFTTLPSITENILTIPHPDNSATKAILSMNEEEIYEINYSGASSFVDKEYTPSTITNYGSGFTRNTSTGYYRSGNAGKNNSYSLMRVTFNFKESTTIVIQYINYAESNWDFGLISKIDTTLATSYTDDGDSKCLYRGYGSANHSSTAKQLIVEIPAGAHTMDFKYRKDNSQNANNDNFQFKIYVRQRIYEPIKIDLTSIPAFKDSGTYEFQVVGGAEGYISTDPITLTYERIAPSVEVEGETLIIDDETVENEILTTSLPIVNEETLIYNT